MNTSRRLVASALTFGLGLSFWGCSTDTVQNQPVPGSVPVVVNTGGTVSPLFRPDLNDPSQIPLPNDLLRDTGATNPANKGLVNQFPQGAPFNTEPFTSLATMRGFSTAGNILVPFDGQIEPASVTPNSVLLIEGPASNAADADTGAGTNATINCNISVVNGQGTGSTGNSVVVLQPVQPLKPATNYYVVVTNAVQSNGEHVTSGNVTQLTKVTTPLFTPAGNTIFPVPDASAQSLEPLRAFYQNLWARAEAITGQPRSAIPFVFRFGTQPISPTLRGIRASVAAINRDVTNKRPLADNFLNALNPAVLTVDQLFGALPTPLNQIPHSNISAVYTANMTVDNYISPAVIPDAATAAATGLPVGAPIGNFVGSSSRIPGETDAVVQNQKVKTLLIFFPKTVVGGGTNPPLVIFQHGINGQKEQALAIADSICQQGFACAAIDLVDHGPQAFNLAAGALGGGDLPTTTPQVPASSASSLFINLTFLRNARDNIRQSVVNLYFLTKLATDNRLTFQLAAPLNNPLTTVDPTIAPGYIGTSLGGIVGTPYTATEWNNRTAVLNVPGGRLGSLLLSSPSFAPPILASLAAKGVVPGTTTFTQFFLIAQTVVDDADPFNYAAPALLGVFKFPGQAALQASRVLQQESVGDVVVPNSASRDLARAFALFPPFRHVQPVVEAVSLLTTAPTDSTVSPNVYRGSGYFQFPNTIPGRGHGSLLTPAEGNTAAYRLQALTYLVTGISLVAGPNGNPAIINPFVAFPNKFLDTINDAYPMPPQNL
jgi:hypothetical protein